MTTQLQEAITVAPPRTTAAAAPGRGMSAFLLQAVLPATLSALLLWLCFFPVAIGWFGWIALVPLLCLVRSNLRPRLIYLAAWISGLLFYWPVLQWMRVADFRMVYTWAMLATYCSLYFPVGIWLIRRIDRLNFVPLIVSVPCVWVALEYIRSFLLTGFAWYYMGHTQHDVLPMIQIADFAGAYGVSFVVVAVNAWLFTLLYSLPAFRDRLGLKEGMSCARVLEQGVLLFFVVVAVLLYGLHRLNEGQFERGPRLALLQGNLDQRLRNEAFNAKDADNSTLSIFRHYLHLCHVAVESQHVRPDLIVWPETSFPAQWVDVSAKVDLSKVPRAAEYAAKIKVQVEELAKLMNENAPDSKTTTLLGVNTSYIDDNARRVLYNSALLVTPDGNCAPRHDKMHRIPFGEFVPLDWLPFMKSLMPYDFDYSITPGTTFTRFPLGEHRFGVLICYEDTDPLLGRRYACDDKDGKTVDFLVNISNDGWFDGTSEHEEHLAISRFRAVECRRAVARSVNMGVSALIDSNGRVLKPNTIEQTEFPQQRSDAAENKPPETLYSWLDRGAPLEDLPVGEWHHYKKTAGVLAMNIPLDRRTSYYALWGDWLPYLCWMLVGVGVVLSMRGQRAREALAR